MLPFGLHSVCHLDRSESWFFPRKESLFLVFTGFQRRLENLENENGHGKIIEHEKLTKSNGILSFSHGISLILPPICTKFVFL